MKHRESEKVFPMVEPYGIRKTALPGILRSFGVGLQDSGNS